MDVLTRETRRLTTDNNHLHTQLISSEDKLDRLERAAKHAQQSAQAQHRQAQERSKALEQQKSDLLERLNDRQGGTRRRRMVA